MNRAILLQELQFKAIRSSGPGGQHVNKVASKVVLSFNVMHSAGLSDREKTQLSAKLASRLTLENVLLLECEETRSQLRNKEKVIRRFFELLKQAFFVPKKRKATKPTKASLKRKKEQKKKRGDLKKTRQKPSY